MTIDSGWAEVTGRITGRTVSCLAEGTAKSLFQNNTSPRFGSLSYIDQANMSIITFILKVAITIVKSNNPRIFIKTRSS